MQHQAARSLIVHEIGRSPQSRADIKYLNIIVFLKTVIHTVSIVPPEIPKTVTGTGSA
jgi:hypothetical protein